MRIVRDIVRYFFEKNAPAVTPADAEWRNRTRYNAIYALDPDVLVRHLNAFNQGDIAGLERVVEEFEQREDKMKIGAFKMAAAVASKPWEVRIVKGEEDNPRARLHQETLTKFWNRIEVTDAFCRNRRGGLRLLVKQMMLAQSRVYDVHDVAWHVNGDGSLKATFTHVPAWSFENRSGRLRYIKNDGQYEGEQMRDGEWLVTVGEGVGITATILAMAKRLSWNDWLLFSERCGMPVVMGNTSAQLGSDAWNALKRAIQAVAPKTGILADTGTQLSTVALSSGGQTTYNDLIGVVDRSISALYRGGDLATMSQGDSVGATSQDGESELMDADGARMVAETLRDQIERHVIRFTCGDFEPLAEIVIDPPVEAEDVDRDIRIDNHLAGLGVRLSKADALARYGRAEATDDADALTLQTPMQTPFNALANEATLGEGRPTGEPPAADGDALERAASELEAIMLERMVKGVADELGKDGNGRTNRPGEPDAAADDVALANSSPYRCPQCGKFAEFSGNCGKCGYTLKGAEAKERTKKLLDKARAGTMQKPVKGIAYREELGQIDLPVGTRGTFEGGERKHGKGLSKMQDKHPQDLDRLPDTLAFGEVLRTRDGDNPEKPENPNRRAIVHGDHVCFLAKAGNTWEITTHYKERKGTGYLKEIAEGLK